MTYLQYIGKAQGKECYYDSFKRISMIIEENGVKYIKFTQEIKGLVDTRLKMNYENIAGFISNQKKKIEKMHSIDENIENDIL